LKSRSSFCSFSRLLSLLKIGKAVVVPVFNDESVQLVVKEKEGASR
jgi:hypothetical protein